MKLYYFSVHAKGLGPALALEVSGLPWLGPKGMGWTEDKWPELKATGKSPFGQLPLLIADGINISQTTAIVNFIGKKAKMEGDTDADFAISQALIAEGEDLYNAMQNYQPTTMVPADGARSDGMSFKGSVENNKTKFWATWVPGHMSKLEEILAGKDKFTTGEKPTVGELYIFSMLHQMKFCNEKVFDGFPALASFYEKILNDASVQKVLKGESSFGEWVDYFIPA